MTEKSRRRPKSYRVEMQWIGKRMTLNVDGEVPAMLRPILLITIGIGLFFALIADEWSFLKGIMVTLSQQL
jgi:hypothetical protein